MPPHALPFRLIQALFTHRKEGMIAVAFLFMFFALQTGYDHVRGTAVETLLIDTLTVRPAAFFINHLTGIQHVVAQGTRLLSPHIALNILNGCEGIESIFLLTAAMLVFDRPWRAKLMGVVGGILFIYGLNQIRIVSLFLSASYNRALFQALHSVIAPTLIILLACLFFLAWAGLTAPADDDFAPPVA